MDQIFRAESAEVYDNYIQLGIRDQNVEFSSNEKGNIVAFVQQGELWCYNEAANQLSRVFKLSLVLFLQDVFVTFTNGIWPN